MNKDLSSGYILTAHLRKYKNYMEPYDASYIPEHDIPISWWNTIEPEPDYLQELALKVLAIVPNSASCERNFSLLSWLTNNKRIQLDVQNLESIAKIYSFFNTNAKKALPYFSAKMTEEQVLQVLNESNGQILEEEIIDQEELLQYIDRPSSNTRSANLNNKLNLESSLNLDSEIFNNNIDFTIDNNDSSSEKSDEEILQNIQDEELNNENNNGVGNFNWDLNDLIIDNNDD
jgi:hypothetical protein